MGDLVGDSDAMLGDSRDSKAMALHRVNTLYSVKVESLEQILDDFPEYREKMIHASRKKKEKHKKLITKCQKKFPVYGLLPFDEPSTRSTGTAAVEKLKKFGLDVDQYNHGSSGKSM